MNKGQVLFGVATIAAAVTVNALDIMNVLGQSAWFFFLLTYPLALLGFIVLLLNFATGTGVSLSYRAPVAEMKGTYVPKEKRKPSHIPRVVIDTTSTDEHIVSGEPTSTFRQVLRSDWPFKGVSKNAQWAIVDERGNDITDSTLESFHGIAELRILGIVEPREYYAGKPDQSQDDENDRYSSIDQGVTYYD